MIEKNAEGGQALLRLLEQQEADLVFDSFDRRDALRLGTMLSETALGFRFPLTVRIFMGDIIAYQFAMARGEENRFGWTLRKYALLKATGHASMHGKVRMELMHELSDFAEHQDIYGFGCGAFPITVKDQGIIGAAVVSGLPDPEDHILVVHAIETMLGKKTVELPPEVDRTFF